MKIMAKLSDRLLILIFILLISIPGIGMFIEKQADEVRTKLNREPYQFPPINIKRLGRTDFKGIENWFVDRALFITSLSKLWANVNYKLGTSIKPGQAVVGKDGWLFLGNDYVNTIDQYTGKNLPIEEEIFLQLNALKHMKQIAAQNNIPFLVVIAPDKQDIYSEYLPNNIQRGLKRNRLDLLEEGMLENDVDFVSLRQKLLQAKDTLGKQYGDLYLKGDSHWNYLGAYVAYQSISNYMTHKGIKTNDLKFNFIPQKTTASDLTNFLQLSNVESNNPLPDIANTKINMLGKDITGTTLKLAAFEGNSNTIIVKDPYENINTALHNKQTCLLISDSFSAALQFYFQNDFHNTVRIHSLNTSYNLSDLINKYHPDIIVYEKVERDLFGQFGNFQPNAEKISLKEPANLWPINGNIDNIKINPEKIIINGWAYLLNKNAAESQIYFKLSNDTQSYIFSMNQMFRQDVRLVFNNEGKHLNLAGFFANILRKDILNGQYKASVIVVNKDKVGEKIFSQDYDILVPTDS